MEDQEIFKTAQDLQNPKLVALCIKNIIEAMVGRMSPEAQIRAYPNIIERIKDLNAFELSQKNQPGGAAIGASISLVKTILNGRDPIFTRVVINELTKEL
jgi:hypothetical protein